MDMHQITTLYAMLYVNYIAVQLGKNHPEQQKKERSYNQKDRQ